MPRRRKKSLRPIEFPSYFPESRYQRDEEELITDNKQIETASLPALVENAATERIFIDHLIRRSIKDEVLNTAGEVVTGDSINSSPVHPGILYGGLAALLLATIGLYFYKLFKKIRENEHRKHKDLEDERYQENYDEILRDTIATAISDRISNAGSSVISSVRGKFAATGSSVLEDFRKQSKTQEYELVEDIKTTILEQEKEMIMDFEEKFSNTKNKLIMDINTKFSRMKNDYEIESSENKNKDSKFHKKRKEEEMLLRLSDSEDEFTKTVKRRMSVGHGALIPEIEKSIESTNKNIIKNIESRIPKTERHLWKTVKSRMMDRSSSLFSEIKTKLTCTEDEIIADVESHIKQIRSNEIEHQIVADDSKCPDEENIHIVQSEKNSSKYAKIGERYKIDLCLVKTPSNNDKIIISDEVQIISETENKKAKNQYDRDAENNHQGEKSIFSDENIRKFNEIKHKLSDIPRKFLKHPVNMPKQGTQIVETHESDSKYRFNDDEQNRIHEKIVERTLPIPIPSTHENSSTFNNFPSKEVFNKVQNNSSENSSGQETDNEEENSSDSLENQESYHPFGLKFSGIPDKLEIRKSTETKIRHSKFTNENFPISIEENNASNSKTIIQKIEKFNFGPTTVRYPNYQNFNCRNSAKEEFNTFQTNSSENSSCQETKNEKENISDSMKNPVSYLPFGSKFSGIPDKVELQKYTETKIKHIIRERSKFYVKKIPISFKENNVSNSQTIKNFNFGPTRVRYPNYQNYDCKSCEGIPLRDWIVLEYSDENPPRLEEENIENENSLDRNILKRFEIDVIKPPKLAWLKQVEGDVNVSWPKHLPKNVHRVNNISRLKHKHIFERTKHSKWEGEDSQKEHSKTQEWGDGPSKRLHIEPEHNNERKASVASTISEFSTTTSVVSSSSDDPESTDSCAGSKLHNSQKGRNRTRRFKSLDSGIHHYYGEYKGIEFSVSDSQCGNHNNDAITRIENKKESLSNQIISNTNDQSREKLIEKSVIENESPQKSPVDERSGKNPTRMDKPENSIEKNSK